MIQEHPEKRDIIRVKVQSITGKQLIIIQTALSIICNQ